MKMPIYRPHYNQNNKEIRPNIFKGKLPKLEKGKLTNSNVITNPNLS